MHVGSVLTALSKVVQKYSISLLRLFASLVSVMPVFFISLVVVRKRSSEPEPPGSDGIDIETLLISHHLWQIAEPEIRQRATNRPVYISYCPGIIAWARPKSQAFLLENERYRAITCKVHK